MELQPLAYMLEDLLHEASDDGLEASLAETPRHDEPLRDEAIRSEYELRYRRAVDAVYELRGAPTFAGRPSEPGGPDGYVADHITCWSDATGLIYVAIRAEDSIVRVFCGAKPHPVEREAITLMPPAV